MEKKVAKLNIKLENRKNIYGYLQTISTDLLRQIKQYLLSYSEKLKGEADKEELKKIV